MVGAPFWRGLVLFCVVPTGGAVRRPRGQSVQQVSVQLLGFRQSDLQQESLHHQLLQLRAENCDKHPEQFRGELKEILHSVSRYKLLEVLILTLERKRLVLCMKDGTIYFLSQM